MRPSCLRARCGSRKPPKPAPIQVASAASGTTSWLGMEAQRLQVRRPGEWVPRSATRVAGWHRRSRPWTHAARVRAAHVRSPTRLRFYVPRGTYKATAPPGASYLESARAATGSRPASPRPPAWLWLDAGVWVATVRAAAHRRSPTPRYPAVGAFLAARCWTRLQPPWDPVAKPFQAAVNDCARRPHPVV
jgi:hypothetical protein